MNAIPTTAGKEIAEKYGYDQVVIIARKTGPEPAANSEYVTTYGVNKLHCDVACAMGNWIKFEVMQWE